VSSSVPFSAVFGGAEYRIPRLALRRVIPYPISFAHISTIH
jgi:hypothetical protein